MENVAIVGNGRRKSVIRLDGRDGSVLRKVRIDSPNADRGIWVRGSNDVEISDCRIQVGGKALVDDNSTFSKVEYTAS